MPDLNKMIGDLSIIQKKTISDLDEMLRISKDLEHDVSQKFREEIQNNKGSMNGLEDFHALTYMCKKNLTSVKNAHSLIVRLKDISKFDISEETESEREIAEILKD